MTDAYFVKSQLQSFITDDLKWCGCGSPDDAMEFMRDVLRAIKARSDAHFDQSSNEILEALLPHESGLAMSYWYMLDEHDLIDHGGQVSGCWLNERGKKILAMLNEVEDWDDALEDVEVSEEEFNRTTAK